jgi:hypothetical protein
MGSMRGMSPWNRLRLATFEIGAGLLLLLLFSGAAPFTFALGLAGAWNVVQALNPEPGTGRGPDLR